MTIPGLPTILKGWWTLGRTHTAQMSQGSRAPLPLHYLCFLFCKRAAEMQCREPATPSPHLGGEGGAGRDPILESQVGGLEGGARRTPQCSGLWWGGGGEGGGWKSRKLTGVSAPLLPWCGVQPALQYANNVEMLCLPEKCRR